MALPVDYKSSGVDIEAADRLISSIGQIAATTPQNGVLAGIGGFASLLALPAGLTEPLLVASCDGVGTKMAVAIAAGRHETIGIDLVAMNVNDLICTGGSPLFFLDYFATSKLDERVGKEIVSGIAAGCLQANMALVGGETAEMPDLYRKNDYDLAGFCIGVVERSRVIDGSKTQAGDQIIGLPSSGLHSNGYSLARKALSFGDADHCAVVPELGRSLVDELLEPTIIYVNAVKRLQDAVPVRACVHITGGGLVDNPPRAIPAGLIWRFDTNTWDVPAVMKLIASRSGISPYEMRRTFNMGLGFLVVVPASSTSDALRELDGSGARVVGEILDRDDHSGAEPTTSVCFVD